jgi:hypothetical protein
MPRSDWLSWLFHHIYWTAQAQAWLRDLTVMAIRNAGMRASRARISPRGVLQCGFVGYMARYHAGDKAGWQWRRN